ncbi:unnamed protein product [Protopolystoma xenopodis]|uniref:Uncharacterized protein n=1 Tax=Protopolystoma xenopodis TaxID=117903 RepID=A0A448X1G9_9PLAT|nr:unnamed protein product [Protopolystoma xenopodis]
MVSSANLAPTMSVLSPSHAQLLASQRGLGQSLQQQQQQQQQQQVLMTTMGPDGTTTTTLQAATLSPHQQQALAHHQQQQQTQQQQLLTVTTPAGAVGGQLLVSAASASQAHQLHQLQQQQQQQLNQQHQQSVLTAATGTPMQTVINAAGQVVGVTTAGAAMAGGPGGGVRWANTVMPVSQGRIGPDFFNIFFAYYPLHPSQVCI